MNVTVQKLSIVLPAKNEALGLVSLLPKLVELFPQAEIIVVDDGSDDDTVNVCQLSGVVVVSHRYSKGNGAAIKAGARRASGDVIVFMDADGQHQPKDVKRLLHAIGSGYDMVVGARSNSAQASVGRLLANTLYNGLASWVVGHKVMDLTSGMRAVRRDKFLEFLDLLPNGFSYPTTTTMAFFRSGYSVNYVDIDVLERKGKSHINLKKDGVRFLLIIFKMATLYSPLKLFLPVSIMFFLLGAGHYLHTYISDGRFTNMSALMFSVSVLIFMLGLVSEQMTALMYSSAVNKK